MFWEMSKAYFGTCVGHVLGHVTGLWWACLIMLQEFGNDLELTWACHEVVSNIFLARFKNDLGVWWARSRNDLGMLWA